MAWIQWLWALAGWPYAFVVGTMGIPLPPVADLISRVLVVALVVYLLYRAAVYIRTELRALIQGKELEPVPPNPPVHGDPHAPPVRTESHDGPAAGRKPPVSDEFEGARKRFQQEKGRK